MAALRLLLFIPLTLLLTLSCNKKKAEEPTPQTPTIDAQGVYRGNTTVFAIQSDNTVVIDDDNGSKPYIKSGAPASDYPVTVKFDIAPNADGAPRFSPDEFKRDSITPSGDYLTLFDFNKIRGLTATRKTAKAGVPVALQFTNTAGSLVWVELGTLSEFSHVPSIKNENDRIMLAAKTNAILDHMERNGSVGCDIRSMKFVWPK